MGRGTVRTHASESTPGLNAFSAEKLATRAGLAAFREVEMTEAGRVSGKSDA